MVWSGFKFVPFLEARLQAPWWHFGTAYRCPCLTAAESMSATSDLLKGQGSGFWLTYVHLGSLYVLLLATLL